MEACYENLQDGIIFPPMTETIPTALRSSDFDTGAVPAPIHPMEEERLARLLGYEILDTGNDPILDKITEIAANICNTPIALVTLLDRNRQWFKSAYGIETRETSRDVSFCAHAILDTENLMIVPDTSKDDRFAHNPLVTGEPHIRFYAGFPLTDDGGFPIGTLCVIDRKPRELGEQQLGIIRKLAEVAMELIESHRSVRNLNHLLHLEKEVYNRLLGSSADLPLRTMTFDEALTSLVTSLDPNLGWLSARIRNLQTGGTTGIHNNGSLPPDPGLTRLWSHIDSTPRHPVEAGVAEAVFIRSDPLSPDYSYLMVPVRNRGRIQAIIELIFPDHRKCDPRIQEVFSLMASNLGIIAERELVLVELQYQATHDILTGAANRSVILKKIEATLRGIDPLEPDSVLFFFDIDGFKEVNDNFGHDTGDRLLIEITNRLNTVCRGDDLLGRLSGDEFILLASGIDVKKGVVSLIQRLIKNLAIPFMLGELELWVTASIGCVVLDNPDITPNELMRRAEEAMYLVKSGERRGFCIADEEVIREFQIRRNMDHKVRNAFRDNRLFLVYQPIMNLRTMKVSGAEILSRLLDKDGTVISAADFIQALHRTRLLPKMDEWALGESLKVFQHPSAKELLSIPDFRISINISPAILSTRGYAVFFLRQLKNAGIPASSLMLEIIESSILLPSETILENLSRFRSEGVMIALDDFGTGYSNLQQLETMPVDIIKIDKQFVDHIVEGNLAKNALLGAIIDIGKNLGYKILAEGVEDEGQLKLLKAMGCHYAQGYHIGKPCPMDEFFHRLVASGEINPPQ